MIAVDTNILVYAHRSDSSFHGSALDTMVSLAEGQQRWAIPWPSVHEFLAITTHPRIYSPPTPMTTAVDALNEWLSSPSCKPIGEGEGYFSRLVDLVRHGKVSGPAVHGARIAAICLHHGVSELWTVDRDFSRFPALKTVNPLVGR